MFTQGQDRERVKDTLEQNNVDLKQLEAYTKLKLKGLEDFITKPSQVTFDALFKEKDENKRTWEHLNFLGDKPELEKFMLDFVNLFAYIKKKDKI